MAASSAFAARGHQFKETFGEPCPALEIPCGAGKLKEPSAVAVNEATGEVYVLDQGNSRVEIFNGEPPVVVGEIEEFEVEGIPQTFSFGAAPQVSGIAVDNSCALQNLTGGACESADPSNEDVYVVDAGHNVVDKFKPNGEFVGQITEAHGEAFSELSGVAVDPAGGLWIYQKGASFRGEIDGFSNAQPNVSIGPNLTLSGRVGFLAPGFAVDSEGNFYPRGTEGRFLVEKFDHTGNQLIRELDTENSSGIAVDLKTDNSFLDNVTTVASFRPDGTELERLGKEAGAEHLTAGAGLAADSVSETIYVADSGAGQVVVFGPQQPQAPEIFSEGVLDISSTSATLEAELNPRSDPNAEPPEAPTTYRFQYGPCSGGLAGCTTSAFPFETGTAALAPDFELHQVTVLITALQPNTIYHFRLFTENDRGEVTGPEKTFTTQTPGGSLLLPDSRQWQLVSPPDKQGALLAPISETGVVQAADDGRAISYIANSPTEPQPQGVGPSGGIQILSTRASGSWLSQDINPPHDTATGPPVSPGKEYRAFSANLSYGFTNPFGPFTPSISAEATEATAFRRADYLNGDPAQQCLAVTMGCYRPLVTGKDGIANVPLGTVFGSQSAGKGGECGGARVVCGPEFVESTPGGDHVVLRSTVPLTPTPIPVGGALYEWGAAAAPAQQLQLVSVLPGAGEQPAAEPFLGQEGRIMRNAISTDGARVVFSEGFRPVKRLFLRDTTKGETIQLDAGEVCPGCESGGGRFQLASADGSRVFFTDSQRLAADSGAGNDLYECQIVENGTGELECDLTDLTPKTAGGEDADVQGSVIGAAADASSVYFVANGVLTEAPDDQGQVARPGSCTFGPLPPGATCNLYRYHDDETKLVAVLSGEDRHDWENALGALPARVAPNGQWLAFMSGRSLTGYDNRDLATGKPTAEVYLYNSAADRLLCASCDPSGARPKGVEYLQLQFNRGGLVGGNETWEQSALVAANLPGWTGNEESGTVTRHQPRYLSNSGRLFFNTVNALVPQDANGTQDVYQYEPPGVGSCTASSPTFGEASEGCVSLISSGTSAQESAFLDASESGNDVFFLTSARLSGLDVDSSRDVYDAHSCPPGAAVPCLPEPPAPPPACQGDACQQPAVPPNHPTPGTALLNGPGNVVQCPKAKVKKSGKCVAKKSKKHKKSHKKHAKKSHSRTAGHNRGGAK